MTQFKTRSDSEYDHVFTDGADDDPEAGETTDVDTDTEDVDDLAIPDYLEDVLVQGIDGDDDLTIKPDAGKKTPKTKKDDTPASKGDDKTAEALKAMEDTVKTLKADKVNLNKALHEQRQKAKKTNKEDEGDALTEAQMIQIYEENKDDPKTLLRLIAHQAEQAANKASGKAIVDSDTKKQVKEADAVILSMYPKFAEDGSDIRRATDETKAFYHLGDNPLGDYFAVGIQVLNALPNIISSAEKRGENKALNTTADGKRKVDIKANQESHKKAADTKGSKLSKSEVETGKQLNLSAGAYKTYQKILGNNSSKTVQVKE